MTKTNYISYHHPMVVPRIIIKNGRTQVTYQSILVGEKLFCSNFPFKFLHLLQISYNIDSCSHIWIGGTKNSNYGCCLTFIQINQRHFLLPTWKTLKPRERERERVVVCIRSNLDITLWMQLGGQKAQTHITFFEEIQNRAVSHAIPKS